MGLLDKLGLREKPDPDGTSAGLTDLTDEEREAEMNNAPPVQVEDPTEDDD